MSVRSVSLQGVLQFPDQKPITGKKVDVYALTDLFKAVHVKELTTEDDGKYRLEYQAQSLKEALVLIIPGKSSKHSLLKKFIPIGENTPEIKIPSPPMRQKKRKLNPHKISRRDSSSSFDELAKSTLGADWESVLLPHLPNKTAELIQKSYKKAHLPLQKEEVVIDFILNSLFFNEPTHAEQEGKVIYTTPGLNGEKFIQKRIPEARFILRHNLTLHMESVAVRYQGEEWITATKNDPNYFRILYLANSAAIVTGLSSRLLALGYVLPSLYAQAFLTSISEKNPLHQLLKAHLTDSLLIDRHIGLPLPNPILSLLNAAGIKSEEIKPLIESALKNPPCLGMERPTIQHALTRQAHDFKEKIIVPYVETFFECHKEAIISSYWEEIYRLSQTFAALHPSNAETQQEWSKPFIAASKNPQKGEVILLRNWCEEALFYATFMPFAVRESVKFLTDLRFASLNPENQAFNEAGNALDPYGATTPENATKQLSKVDQFLEKRKTPLLKLSNISPALLKLLEDNAKELKVIGIDIEALTI